MGLKDKIHMITSIDVEKNLWQNPTCFHDKNCRECRATGNISQHNKNYTIPTVNIILNGESLEAIPLKSFLLLFNIVPDVLAGTIRQKKEIKGIHIRKKVWLSPFADDMILYIRDPKNSTRNFLEMITKFSHVAGYRITLHASTVFLYTSKYTEKEVMGTYPSQLPQRK